MARVRLVLCAGIVPSELHGELGQTRSGLIPLSGRCLIQKHLEITRLNDIRLIFVIDKTDTRSNRYCELLGADYRFVNGSEPLGPTIKNVLQSLDKDEFSFDSLEILFGDTLSNDELLLDSIGTVFVPDTEEWTQVNLEDGDLVFSHNGKTALPTVAGYFSFSDPVSFLANLDSEVNFWEAMTRYHREVCNLEIVKLSHWLDFGRIDTLFHSRQLSFNTRHFNEVTYLPERGTVRKSSDLENRQKIIDEALWYTSLEGDLQSLTPAVRDVNLVDGNYELDYLTTPTLAEMLLFSNMRIGYWERFFESLNGFLELLYSKPIKPATKGAQSIALKSMYVDKIVNRFEQTKNQTPILGALKYQVNKSKSLKLETGIEALIEWGERQVSDADTQFTFIHGDLFFGNMFFDRKLGLVRAIDPRGRFGDLSGQGDRRYDLGKITHSLLSGYDLLAADLFQTAVLDNRVFVETATSIITRPINVIAEQWVNTYCRHAKTSLFDVRMIEAGLFLSMAPLHAESPERQLGLIWTGLKVLSDLEVI